jgi:N-acetylmuramoyl-L-alanine amidase
VAAGAKVTLTREKDQELDIEDQVDLKQRADIANRQRADLLLSIHHNAADKPSVNYTTVFYHSSPEHSRASITAARYLLDGLSDALRLAQQADDAVLEDRDLTKSGFAVLRQCFVPAVLTEASFHSNPDEEQRLGDSLYNRREAYGLFLGLARWARAGLPRVALQQCSGGMALVSVEDGLPGHNGIFPHSFDVRLDGKELPFKFDPAGRKLSINLAGAKGRAKLYVDFETVLGQHVVHPLIELNIGP